MYIAITICSSSLQIDSCYIQHNARKKSKFHINIFNANLEKECYLKTMTNSAKILRNYALHIVLLQPLIMLN